MLEGGCLGEAPKVHEAAGDFIILKETTELGALYMGLVLFWLRILLYS